MASKRRISVRRIVFFTVLYAGIPLIAGSFVVAKMITQAAITKETTVQVAEWDVAITGESTQSQDEHVGLVAGNEDEEKLQTYALSVTNDSDTASKYVIRLSGVPADVMARLDADTTGGSFKNPNNGVIMLTNTGSELGAHKNRNHTIQFVAKQSANAMTDHNITVEVVFTQKDPQ